MELKTYPPGCRLDLAWFAFKPTACGSVRCGFLLALAWFTSSGGSQSPPRRKETQTIQWKRTETCQLWALTCQSVIYLRSQSSRPVDILTATSWKTLTSNHLAKLLPDSWSTATTWINKFFSNCEPWSICDWWNQFKTLQLSKKLVRKDSRVCDNKHYFLKIWFQFHIYMCTE